MLRGSAAALLDFMRGGRSRVTCRVLVGCVALPHSLLMWGFRGIPLPFVLVDC